MQLTNAGARPAIMAVKISVRRAVASRWLKLKSCGRLYLPEVGGTMTLHFTCFVGCVSALQHSLIKKLQSVAP